MAERDDLLSVDLETVTPLFLSADPVHDKFPELRPPSVRGALRFWWRAWRQATKPCATVNELFKEESALFGSTGGASSLIVRLGGAPQRLDWVRQQEPSGLDYMLYGLHTRQGGRRPSGRREPVRLCYRPAFRPGQEFRLTLARRPQRGGPQALDQGALAALWLLCNLGGLGARSRRGAGALRPLQVTAGDWPEELPPLALAAPSPGEYCRSLAAALERLCRPLVRPQPPALGIPVLHPAVLTLAVFGKTWTSWEAALEEVGASLAAFRRRYRLDVPGSDYHGVKDFITTGHAPKVIRRAAFGLPLQFYYTSLRGAKASVTAVSAAGEPIDRSASRLHFRVVRLSGDREAYTVLLYAFRPSLLPAGARLEVKSGVHVDTLAPPDSSIFGEYTAFAESNVAKLLGVRYA